MKSVVTVVRSEEVLVTLRGLAPSLVPSLHRVARVILADPAGVAGDTVSELARCDVQGRC